LDSGSCPDLVGLGLGSHTLGLGPDSRHAGLGFDKTWTRCISVRMYSFRVFCRIRIKLSDASRFVPLSSFLVSVRTEVRCAFHHKERRNSGTMLIRLIKVKLRALPNSVCDFQPETFL
jgi:hypothetical protein